MAWSELDAESGVFVLPAERSKNELEHPLWLPPLAWDIIQAVPRMANRDQLFGARTDKGFTAWAAGKADLDRKLGTAVAPFVLHDIRRSVATGMANIGVQPHVIEQILNHVCGHKSGIAGVYNRSELPARGEGGDGIMGRSRPQPWPKAASAKSYGCRVLPLDARQRRLYLGVRRPRWFSFL